VKTQVGRKEKYDNQNAVSTIGNTCGSGPFGGPDGR